MNLPNINKKRIITLLKENKRVGNRKPFEIRDIEIESNISINAEGSARVRIGKTEVIAGVKMATQEPYPDHDDEGTMSVGMEFSPICGERYEAGPPKMDSIEVARVVDRGIRESGFIDWKKLCIAPGEKVWSIAIDIYCINDDGNVFDASSLAAISALKMARFPVFNEETGKVQFGEFTDTALPLTNKVPLSLTFHKIGEGLILDPNRDEEDASEARLTIAISKPEKDKLINAMQKGGITGLTSEEMETIIKEAEIAYDSLVPIIEKKTKSLK